MYICLLQRGYKFLEALARQLQLIRRQMHIGSPLKRNQILVVFLSVNLGVDVGHFFVKCNLPLRVGQDNRKFAHGIGGVAMRRRQAAPPRFENLFTQSFGSREFSLLLKDPRDVFLVASRLGMVGAPNDADEGYGPPRVVKKIPAVER